MNYARLIVESDKKNRVPEINQSGIRKSDVDQMGNLGGFGPKTIAKSLFKRATPKSKEKD